MTIDFVGTGKRLSSSDYADDAERLGVPVSTVLGLVEVEAAGSGFDSRSRPKILFEPHIFWRELGAGPERDEAARLGLAYAKWGSRPYPRTSDENYARLTAAVVIDEDAALRSASWGLAQIMGFNHRAAGGYATARAMVEDFKLGENEQLAAFTALVDEWNLEGVLRSRDAAAFARRYNGPAYATNKYDQKLRAAWAKYDAQGAALPDRKPSAPIDVSIREPDETTWQRLQAVLNDLGLRDAEGDVLLVDGDPGPATLAAARGLVPKIEAAIAGKRRK